MEPPENEPFNETMSFRELSLSSLHLESSLKVTPEALRSIVKGLLDRPWQDRQHLLSFSLKVDQDTFAEVSYDLFDLKQRSQKEVTKEAVMKEVAMEVWPSLE